MGKLGESQLEQIKSMKADGKSIPQIQEFLHTTYQISISPQGLYAALKAKGTQELNGEAGKTKTFNITPKKRKYTKRAEVKATPIPSTKSDINDIITLLSEIDNGYKKVFAYLRTELIKSRSQVYSMLTGAGIDISESEIQ